MMAQVETNSIKKNFAYKSLLTISNYLMAFITFPYVSRVLGVEGIGLVNFVDNTINYFLLFATLGVSVLGVREIARVRDNAQSRSVVFSNILGINLMFTLLTIIVYVILISSIPRFEQYSELLYIGISKILFSAFLIEWFYTGIENFKYITIRTLIIKTLYVASVFIFVQTKGDYKLYFILTLFVTIINALINIGYSRKFVKIQVKELFRLNFLKQNLTLGIYNIMTSMYLTFNVMYLGLTCNNIQVGYYTTAYKLYSVVLGFFTAFTNVMLPRMSSLIAKDEREQFNLLINKSFSIISSFSVPLIICSIILAPEIIFVLSGPGYDGAILPMRIIMPAILLVGIAQVLAIQILMPLKKDSVLLRTSIIGAAISVVINLIFVRYLESVGSAIVLLCSEFAVTFSYILYIRFNTEYRFNWHLLLHSILLSVPPAVICVILPRYIENIYISLAVTCCFAAIVWGILTLLSRTYLMRV